MELGFTLHVFTLTLALSPQGRGKYSFSSILFGFSFYNRFMGVLLGFAFVSGLVTIFAPCIWPLLPIVLSSSSVGGRRKPLGVTLGILISFTVLTLSISYIVTVIPFNPDILRIFAVLVIGFLGLTLLVPRLSGVLESFV